MCDDMQDTYLAPLRRSISFEFELCRASYKLDTQPLISSVRARLISSQSILSDMLPDHVVRLLMVGTLRILQEREEGQNLDPKADSDSGDAAKEGQNYGASEASVRRSKSGPCMRCSGDDSN